MTVKTQEIEINLKPLDENFGYHLRRVAVMCQTALSETLKELNLIPATSSIMLALNQNKNIIQLELARILGLQRTNISPLIISLEKQGFISRIEHDGRSQNLKLTEHGKQQIEPITALLKLHADECFSKVPKPQLKNLEFILNVSQRKLDKKFSTDDAKSINQQLSQKIQRTSSLSMSKLIKALALIELTPTSSSILILIHQNPGIIQSKIASILGIKTANISKLIREHKDKGRVTSTPKGRAQTLLLSDIGKALVKPIEETMFHHEKKFFGDNSSNEIIEGIAALKNIHQQLSESSKI